MSFITFSELQTGDLIFVSDPSTVVCNWFTKLIEFFGHTKITHVAIFYRHDDGSESIINIDYYNKIYMCSISEFLSYYTHLKMYTRKLINVDRKLIQNVVTSVYEDTKGKPYNINVIEMFEAQYDSNNDLPFNKANNIESFYCSSYCSYVYERLGIIDSKIDITKITPHELYNNGVEGIHYENLTSPIFIYQK